MAIVERPGKRRMRWVVEYRDSTNTRRYKTCYSLEAAKKFEAEKVLDPGGPDVTVEQSAQRWLEIAATTVKPQTLAVYRGTLDNHILPELGRLKTSELSRGRAKAFLASKLSSGLSKKTVASILSCLVSICHAAIDWGVLSTNPLLNMSRSLGLTRLGSRDKVKALTQSELRQLLDAALEMHAHLYPMLFLMSRTGMRIGEALALEWRHVDFTASKINIVQNQVGRRIGTPKSGKGRHVDMCSSLRDLLSSIRTQRLELKLKNGLSEVPRWVVVDKAGRYILKNRATAQFREIADRAGLPKHVTSHSLRHTFASTHISLGTPIGYVKEQLGHASIAMTYDIYGHWLVGADPSAAEHLDRALGGLAF